MATERSTTTTTGLSDGADATREEASQVAHHAAEEAHDVMQQARGQVTSTVGNLQAEVRARADEEAAKLAHTLHDTSRRMAAMADADGQSLAGSVVREAAHTADRIASHLESGGVERVVADVRSWARRNPGSFLLGATVTGFVMGRVVRNLSDNSSDADRAAGREYRNDPSNDALIYPAPQALAPGSFDSGGGS